MEKPMPTYQVQLWLNGQWDHKDYQKVDAPTARAAAERLCGSQLREQGSLHQIRARVRLLGDLQSTATVFYEV